MADFMSYGKPEIIDPVLTAGIEYDWIIFDPEGCAVRVGFG
jgi:hypothetical protein